MICLYCPSGIYKETLHEADQRGFTHIGRFIPLTRGARGSMGPLGPWPCGPVRGSREAIYTCIREYQDLKGHNVRLSKKAA